ncbi:LOW QUALITY PROTEIN: phospholipase C, partial [Mycobacterium tuberculosis T46]
MSASPLLGMSRREFLTKLTGAGAAAFLMDWAAPVIEKAYGAGPCPGHLTDIGAYRVADAGEPGHSTTISERFPAPMGSTPRRR